MRGIFNANPIRGELLACQVLKEFLSLDCRGFATHRTDHPDLACQIGMKTVPRHAALAEPDECGRRHRDEAK